MVTPTPNYVLDMLRQLPPRERLKVISTALPEIEKTLSAKPKSYKSLCGLWKDLRPSISADEIDAVRKEMWKDFPREGIA
ncbi:MAG: hypothetical protein C0393_07575 [Anaerolinea sp.]|nr:hypothetical protein [Anaerolinea sp.]